MPFLLTSASILQHPHSLLAFYAVSWTDNCAYQWGHPSYVNSCLADHLSVSCTTYHPINSRSFYEHAS
jgi:hypothetical protein